LKGERGVTAMLDGSSVGGTGSVGLIEGPPGPPGPRGNFILFTNTFVSVVIVV
jgi:hypothetical protein